MISEVEHSMSDKQSNFKFMLVQRGLEHLLHDNETTSISSTASTNKESHSQLKVKNLNFINSFKISVSSQFTIRNVIFTDKATFGSVRGIGGAAQIDKNNTVHDINALGVSKTESVVIE